MSGIVTGSVPSSGTCGMLPLVLDNGPVHEMVFFHTGYKSSGQLLPLEVGLGIKVDPSSSMIFLGMVFFARTASTFS